MSLVQAITAAPGTTLYVGAATLRPGEELLVDPSIAGPLIASGQALAVGGTITVPPNAPAFILLSVNGVNKPVAIGAGLQISNDSGTLLSTAGDGSSVVIGTLASQAAPGTLTAQVSSLGTSLSALGTTATSLGGSVSTLGTTLASHGTSLSSLGSSVAALGVPDGTSLKTSTSGTGTTAVTTLSVGAVDVATVAQPGGLNRVSIGTLKKYSVLIEDFGGGLQTDNGAAITAATAEVITAGITGMEMLLPPGNLPFSTTGTLGTFNLRLRGKGKDVTTLLGADALGAGVIQIGSCAPGGDSPTSFAPTPGQYAIGDNAHVAGMTISRVTQASGSHTPRGAIVYGSITGTTLTIVTVVAGTVAAGLLRGSRAAAGTQVLSGSGSTWTVDRTQTSGLGIFRIGCAIGIDHAYGHQVQYSDLRIRDQFLGRVIDCNSGPDTGGYDHQIAIRQHNHQVDFNSCAAAYDWLGRCADFEAGDTTYGLNQYETLQPALACVILSDVAQEMKFRGAVMIPSGGANNTTDCFMALGWRGYPTAVKADGILGLLDCYSEGTRFALTIKDNLDNGPGASFVKMKGGQLQCQSGLFNIDPDVGFYALDVEGVESGSGTTTIPNAILGRIRGCDFAGLVLTGQVASDANLVVSDCDITGSLAITGSYGALLVHDVRLSAGATYSDTSSGTRRLRDLTLYHAPIPDADWQPDGSGVIRLYLSGAASGTNGTTRLLQGGSAGQSTPNAWNSINLPIGAQGIVTGRLVGQNTGARGNATARDTAFEVSNLGTGTTNAVAIPNGIVAGADSYSAGDGAGLTLTATADNTVGGVNLSVALPTNDTGPWRVTFEGTLIVTTN